MRIVLATTVAGPGGVWRHVRDLGTGLRDAGHDVAIAPLPAAASLRRLAAEAMLETVPLGSPTPADVWHLHLHDTFDRRALPLLAARRGARGATVVTEHLPRSNASDPTLLPGPRTLGAAPAKTLLKRAQALFARRIIAVSAASGRFLASRYGLGPPKLTVVVNGIDAGRAPPPPEDEPIEVVAVGSLSVQKGHDVLIQAAGLSKVPWLVNIVGEGPARQRLERLAKASPGGRVRLSGWQEDAGAAIAAAAVACLPSRWESGPYVLLEAAALARPVVASAVDGVPEATLDGETGFLVPPDDPHRLAAAIDRLARDPVLRGEFGEAGRARVKRDFTRERMVDQTLAVYEEARG